MKRALPAQPVAFDGGAALATAGRQLHLGSAVTATPRSNGATPSERTRGRHGTNDRPTGRTIFR